MTIIKQSRDFLPEDFYRLAMSQTSLKMSDIIGQTVEIVDWVIYNEDNDKPNLFSLETPEGEVYTTNSATLIKEFLRIIDFFAEYDKKVTSIEIISGNSKAGRTFITCVYKG